MLNYCSYYSKVLPKYRRYKFDGILHIDYLNGFAVFINFELTPLQAAQAVQPVLKYFKYDNVHIELDPEYQVYG